jgi:hypothetical protein
MSIKTNQQRSIFVSDFHLVLIVENLELFAVLDLLGLLFKLPLEQGVADDADSDVDGLDIVLNLSDRLLNVLQRRVVTEGLPCVVNLARCVIQSLVNVGQLLLQLLHILAHGRECFLVLTNLV